jgi:NAD(P)-dependent dehydrogenase (short-subunit alcohol dehydrogenase family)
VVNNAGICSEASNPQPIDQVDEDGFDDHMRINARGVFLGSKYSVQQFLKQEPRANGMRGWIVNFASMVSNIGMQGLSKLILDERNSCMQLTQYSWIHGIQGRCCCYD